MRVLLVLLVAAVSASCLAPADVEAKPLTCVVNDRSGALMPARQVPNGGKVRTEVPIGTVVEPMTFASDKHGASWVLIGQPGLPYISFGWVDWRGVTCIY